MTRRTWDWPLTFETSRMCLPFRRSTRMSGHSIRWRLHCTTICLSSLCWSTTANTAGATLTGRVPMPTNDRYSTCTVNRRHPLRFWTLTPRKWRTSWTAGSTRLRHPKIVVCLDGNILRQVWTSCRARYCNGCKMLSSAPTGGSTSHSLGVHICRANQTIIWSSRRSQGMPSGMLRATPRTLQRVSWCSTVSASPRRAPG